jgi:hypothetical protein
MQQTFRDRHGDADLSFYFGSGDRKAHSGYRSEGKRCEYLHKFSSVLRLFAYYSYAIHKLKWALPQIAQFSDQSL